MIEAMKEISDPLVAVRAHGLITLRSLVLTKDQHVLENLQELISIFKSSIVEEDEYVSKHYVE